MKEGRRHKVNCWTFLKCGRGPRCAEPCAVATDTASDGINGGQNGGRSCWVSGGTLSGRKDLAPCAQETDCLACDFLHLVKSQEGHAFQLLTLARGVQNPKELQHTITKVESLMAIHERLRSHFDLDESIQEITAEARRVTGAQRVLVLLLKGNPPALQGEFVLRGKRHQVRIDIDETSAAGFAALHNQIVNLRDIYDTDRAGSVPVFCQAFDEQSGCRTQSFLAASICDSEGRGIGVITAANTRKGHFSSDDEWFMEQYATEVALAVEKQKFVQRSVSALRLGAIDETVAGLSHCIKNIAQALRAGSHVIKRALQSDNVQDIRAAWEILDRHIERLAELSMDVLAYDPVVKEHSAGGNLNDLVEHLVNLFRQEARARSIEIRFRKGKNVDPARFDPMGVYRCLVNLISNAFDACPLSDGVVRIRTKRTDGHEFCISVTDNGRGMDEEARAAVFDVFHTSKPRKGTGLGLPTVADIIKRHNGRVEIDSQPGRGTTFRVFFHEDVAVV